MELSNKVFTDPDFLKALNCLKRSKLSGVPGLQKYKIFMAVKEILNAAELFMATRDALLMEHGEEKETGTYTLGEAGVEAFNKEIKEVLEQSFEIKVEEKIPFPQALLDNDELTMGEFQALENLFDFSTLDN